ncbi:IS630 family transposase [Spirosoma linguale]|uniref:IS630 family transposase n=1 Tax=Spirosoma linguale TaxID=108 RepID=UPI003CC7FE3D
MGGPPPRVSYDPSQIGRLLKKAGWSRQKPQKQARQQDPQAVQQWREQRLPHRRSDRTQPERRSVKAKIERRIILFLDEAACYLLPFLAHTWAPCGQTPLLLEQAGRAHLSLIAAIAPNGRLYLAGQDKPFNSEDIIWFLGKLCWHYRRQNLLVIWDGAAIHRSQTVKEWRHKKPGRVHLERLPAYSPMLNPVGRRGGGVSMEPA